MEWARAGETNIAIEEYISGDCLSPPLTLLFSGRLALPKKIELTGPWLSSLPALFCTSKFRIKADICGDPKPNMEASMAARTSALSNHRTDLYSLIWIEKCL
jgi:hypothetical protein